ncbi:MAG: hypothetical protein ACYS19_09145 [Planctomycetota bacterium]|jgi:hypothetical protein
MKTKSLTIIIAGMLVALAQAQRIPIPNDENGWYKNNNSNKQKVFSQVFDAESLVLDMDRDYVDVLLRRVSALLGEISRMENAPDLTWEQGQFNRLLGQAEVTGISSSAREDIYYGLLVLRRTIMTSPPMRLTGPAPTCATSTMGSTRKRAVACSSCTMPSRIVPSW